MFDAMAFDTTATHLTFAGAGATADAFLGAGRAGVVTKFVQFHIASPFAGNGPRSEMDQTRRFLIVESGL